MGKRSNFKRRKNDAYDTPEKPVRRLMSHLRGITSFAEPCAGKGYLVDHLEARGLTCTYRGDIKNGLDALTFPFEQHFRFDAIITNPPWTREIMHPMIQRFQAIAPTWLLFDADWAYTEQAIPFIDQCSHIVAVGRVKWIEDSQHVGKDNASWYRFHAQHTGGPRFIIEKVAA